jgi:acetoin utilization protein AcuB
MILENIMNRRVVTVGMDDSLATIRDLFQQARFHHLFVIEAGCLVGVISDRDLLKQLSPALGTGAETRRDAATLNKRAHQIMVRQPVTASAHMSVREAAQHLFDHDVSCLPVVDGSNRLEGVVTWKDLLRAALAPGATDGPA